MSGVEDIHELICSCVKKEGNNMNKHPAELFDRHPITLMMVADNDIGCYPNLIKISNNWKPDWLKDGVQVPTRDDSLLPSACVQPDKLIRCSRDEFYAPAVHHVSKKGIGALVCYNLDDLDYAWLATVNEERECLCEEKVQDWMLEDVMEAAEQICFIKSRLDSSALEVNKNPEFDENARCDICQSYDGEDGNELVFCDGCLICVHQACYGVPHLPEGSWLCRRCEMQAKSTTPCALCPNTGGAMKLVDDYKSWCHVSCALWVPEVAFEDVELMEPITKLTDIPQARKNLLCSLCKIHCGAPIQCSVKKCKVAFHVTCAFQNNLVMIQELAGYDVRLLAHCTRHSSKEYQSRLSLLRTPKKEIDQKDQANCTFTSPLSPNTPIKKESPDKQADFSGQLDGPSANFYHHVSLSDVTALLKRWSRQRNSKRKSDQHDCGFSEGGRCIPRDIIELLLTYWRLKRRSNFNQPLVEVPEQWMTATLPAKSPSEVAAETSAEVVNRCKHIRFGLDRARLILDMVLTREKKKRALLRTMKAVSRTQLDCLINDPDTVLSDEVFATAHRGSSVYENHALLQTSVEPRDEQAYLENSNSSKKQKPTGEKRSGYIVTGNPVVDDLLPEQLIVSEDILTRLRSVFSKKANKRKRNPLTGKQVMMTGGKLVLSRRQAKSPIASTPTPPSMSANSVHDTSPLTRRDVLSSTKLHPGRPPIWKQQKLGSFVRLPVGGTARGQRRALSTVQHNDEELRPSKRMKLESENGLQNFSEKPSLNLAANCW
ncbi:unnamed protein product [Mesocestoides corti]|uniref:PHD-type domain-containing protein n=1 Tax=Mesocestoides corti TaxID=53468 RepID=A0A0R3ULM9_MESCO|nr:unnamed protein product [Mesocestoides corti]